MDAQKLDLGGLMAQLTDLVKRAKAGRLKASELQPGSITVSSLADNGPDLLYGVIYPPQVALVGWAVSATTVRRGRRTGRTHHRHRHGFVTTVPPTDAPALDS